MKSIILGNTNIKNIYPSKLLEPSPDVKPNAYPRS